MSSIASLTITLESAGAFVPLTGAIAATSTFAGAIDNQNALASSITSTSTLAGVLLTAPFFHIANVDSDNTVYDGQLAVEINCQLAGAVQGRVTFDGIEQTITSWTDTLITLTDVDATALGLGFYDITVLKPVV
jgi:hypothetical protein